MSYYNSRNALPEAKETLRRVYLIKSIQVGWGTVFNTKIICLLLLLYKRDLSWEKGKTFWSVSSIKQGSEQGPQHAMARGLYTSCSLQLISKQRSTKEISNSWRVFPFVRKQTTELTRDRKIFLIQKARKVKNKAGIMLCFVMLYHSTTAQLQNPTLLSCGLLFPLIFF